MRSNHFALASLLVLSLWGCGDDDASDAGDAPDASTDASTDATTEGDVSIPDDAAPDAVDSGGDDAGPESGCVQVAPETWRLENLDDVSVQYEATLDRRVEDSSFGFLLLFERYMPGPDVGTFDLASEPDNNFGTCAHCAYSRSLTLPGLTFFADRGTLELRRDPYGRVLSAVGTNIRLVEVTLDPETRSSTPVPDGRCLEIADFDVAQDFPADGWTCDRALFGDGDCHCDCGAFDPDCMSDFPNPAPEPVDCTETEICDFNPITRAGFCNAICDVGTPFSCTTGVCIPGTSGMNSDRCASTMDIISPAMHDEPCRSPVGLQGYCNVVDGTAQGYCDYEDVCRRLCEGPADCEGTGFDCQSWVFGADGPGYCGFIPDDG